VTSVRVVVVDDEPLAREGLVELLTPHDGIEVVGAFPDGASALAALDALRPAAIFVDVQMPGMSGFDLVDALELDPLPAIVFVTAYDEYAIRAFEVNAIDYLLKPVATDRLAQTVERVRAHVRARATAGGEERYRERMSALLHSLAPERAEGVGRLIVREVGQIIVVATRDVDWVEGADYYVKLHVRNTVRMLRESMASLEQRLDSRKFLRIHRSAIVNLTRVRAVESSLRGDGVVVLADGTRLKVTRAKRDELERRLEQLHDQL
jgi:two-component system LytT family response regulator